MNRLSPAWLALVVAVITLGCGIASSPVAPPTAPSTLIATAASSSQINLGWIIGFSNVHGLKIERCQGAGCTNFAEVAQTGPNNTGFIDSSLAGGTTYSYRVRAFNAGGNSAYSNTASATTQSSSSPPAAPTNLAATAASSSQIDLSWTETGTNADGFKVERCQGTGCAAFAQVAQLPANTTTFSDTGVSANTTYDYRVRAFNTSGNSAYSNVAEGTTPGPPSTDSLLAGMTPDNFVLPTGWTLVRKQNFEGSLPSDESVLGTIATTRSHSGTKSLGGTIATDATEIKWILAAGSTPTFSEIYVSFYDFKESQGRLNDEMFLAQFQKNFADGTYAQVITDIFGAADGGFNQLTGPIVAETQGSAPGTPDQSLYGGSPNLGWGSWVQWEIHYKPNSPGVSNGFFRVYENGALTVDFESANLNGTINMNGMFVQVGGVYSKFPWTSNGQDPSSGTCTSSIGQGLPNTNHPGASFATLASICGPLAPTFNRFIDDIIVMKK